MKYILSISLFLILLNLYKCASISCEIDYTPSTNITSNLNSNLRSCSSNLVLSSNIDSTKLEGTYGENLNDSVSLTNNINDRSNIFIY